MDLKRAILEVPLPSHNYLCPAELCDEVDLSAVPHLRVASWAVSLARAEDAAPHIVASGPLAGLLQFAFRAEATAVLVALRFALAFRLQVRVWSDCLGVVVKVRRLVQGLRVGPTSRNADLWVAISEALLALGDKFAGIFKVEAHVDHVACEDEVTRWACYNNMVADQAAGQANLQRDAWFWRLWDRVRKDLTPQQLIGDRVFRVHLAVAKAVRVAQRQPTTADAPREFPVVSIMDVPTAGEDRLREVFSRYGRPFVVTLLSWLRLISGPGVSSPPRWISHIQLYIAFVSGTSVRPPMYRTSSKLWYSVGNDAVLRLREVPLGKRATWFRMQVRDCIRAVEGTLVSRQIRPWSELLQVALSSSFMRFPDALFQEVESKLSTALGHACVRHDRRWRHLQL